MMATVSLILSTVFNPKYQVYHGLEKIWHEKIFVGSRVQWKLNTCNFLITNKLEQFIMVCSLLSQKIFATNFFLMNISSHEF